MVSWSNIFIHSETSIYENCKKISRCWVIRLAFLCLCFECGSYPPGIKLASHFHPTSLFSRLISSKFANKSLHRAGNCRRRREGIIKSGFNIVRGRRVCHADVKGHSFHPGRIRGYASKTRIYEHMGTRRARA